MKSAFVFFFILFSFYSNAQHELLNSVCFNSEGDDYCVRIIKDRIYFISDTPDSSRSKIKDKTSNHWFTDIYQVSNCVKSEAKLIKNTIGQEVSINSSWYDGPITFSKKDSVIFFSNTSEGLEHGKMGIYWSKELSDGSFTDPKPLSFNSPNYSCIHPFFDENSSYLYFSSDVNNDSSNFDIYKVSFTNSEFGQIETIPVLNTSKNELFPFVFNGKIYFSSNRNGGLGGLDMYFYDSLNTITALKSPFNGEFDDFAISFTNSNRGYFASNRKNNSTDDIYEFYSPNIEVIELAKNDNSGLINDLEKLLKKSEPNSSDALILQAAIDKLKEQDAMIAKLSTQLKDNQDKLMNFVDTSSFLTFEERISMYQNIIETSSVTELVSSDKTEINQLESSMPKEISALMNNVIESKKTISTTSTNERNYFEEKLIPFIQEQPKEIGDINDIVSHYAINDSVVTKLFEATYPLKFYFEFDHFVLNEKQMKEVRQFINAVKGFNGQILLTGHTDNVGSDRYNLKLSKQRAEFIAKLLVAEGFSEENIKIQAKGESEPAVPNQKGNKGTLLNRRVVVRLVPFN